MTSTYKLPSGLQRPLVFGLVGLSGSGKTTLAVKLIKYFTLKGLHITSIKHAHMGFDIDHPGKDSMKHREAGARKVIVSSPVRVAEIEERCAEATLNQLLTRVSKNTDIVLIEGYKKEAHPKIEVYRPENGSPALNRHEFPNILAQASPGGILDIDDIPAIAAQALKIAQPLCQLAQHNG